MKPLSHVLLLVLLTIGFRMIHLGADPPANFSWSGGYFADEGYWSHNARNAVLFGDPLQDEWDARAVSPLFAHIQLASFQTFGVGIRQARLIGIVSALLLTIFTYLIMRRQADDAVAFLGAALVSLNYPMLVLGRQGLLDPFAAALALLSLYLAASSRKSAIFFAGLFFVAACATKYLMIFLIVPLLFALPRERKAMITFAAGLASAGCLWLFGHYFPNRELLSEYGTFYSSQQNWQPLSVIKNAALQPFFLYFVKTPAILFFGNLMLWYGITHFKKTQGIERTLVVWLVAGILFFALWGYRPLRYYTSLILPLACLAAFALWKGVDLRNALHEGGRRWWLVFGMILPAAQILFVLVDRFVGPGIVPEQLGIETTDAVLFLLLTALAPLVLRKPAWMALSFCVVFLASDMKSYAVWMAKPQYQAIAISSDLQQRVGDGVLTGQWASELCLENRVRVVPVWHGFVNTTDPFRRYGITHVLVWRYALGGEKFEEWYPQDFKAFHESARYMIKDSELILYQRQEGP